MKLNGQDILVFGLPRIDSEIESTNYTTARLLAKSNRVFYVENPFTLMDFWRMRKTAQYQRRKSFFSLFSTKVMPTDTENLHLVIPPVMFSINFLPEGWLFRRALKINEFILSFKLKRIIEKYGVSNFIYINSFNFHYPGLADRLKPFLKVYHCLDPLVLAFDRRHGIVSEDLIVEDSDIVICSAKQLYEEKKVLNKVTYFVPNAADLSHSIKVLEPSLKVYEKIAALKYPVVGYFGAIERRIDYPLLQEVISANRDKTFVFVGPVQGDYVSDEFRKNPNVVFTGPVPYSEMPAVIKGFDVTLIPFKKDEFSKTIFPLKLFEYLGAGKPVVCTDFNMDLAEFTADTVAYCATSEAFSEAIKVALSSDNAENVQKRIKVASENTWEKRVEEIGDIIFRSLIEREMAEIFQS